MKLFLSKAQKEELTRDAKMVRELFWKHEDLPGHPGRKERYDNILAWFLGKNIRTLSGRHGLRTLRGTGNGKR